MKCAKNEFALTLLCLAFAIPTCAQVGIEETPDIPGAFKPVVGAGAQYNILAKDGSRILLEVAVVGEEEVGGDEGYWLESRMFFSKAGWTVLKQLVVINGKRESSKRVIVQSPGQPAVALPLRTLGGGPSDTLFALRTRPEPGTFDFGVSESPYLRFGNIKTWERVATETITVPAGTFGCEHYRGKTGSRAVADIWMSPNVTPYGLVKMTSKEETVILQKVLESQTSQIKDEPKKMP
jgi:hypothetical protein